MITLNIKKSNKANGDYSAYVSFPYNEEVVSIIRNMPSRYWDNNTKEWEIPLKKIITLIPQLQKFDINLIGNLSVLEDEVRMPANINYKFKTKPYAHQIDGFKFGMEHDRWLLADEQGLGKTKQVIYIAVAKKKELG